MDEPLELPTLPTQKPQSEYPRDPIRPAKFAAIALVGEVRGEIEPCGCPTLPFGGFDRRQNYLQELSARLPTFHLDAGELLLKGFSMGSRYDKKQRIELLVKLSKQVGVDAWAVGPTDLRALGLERLQKIDAPAKISATWVDENGQWLFQPTITVEKQGVRLGVIGLSAKPTDPHTRDKVHFLAPHIAIEKAINAMTEKVDLLIALGSLDDIEAETLAQKQPKIAAILTTRGTSYHDPVSSNNQLTQPMIIETPERGRYVQSVYLRIAGNASRALLQAPNEQYWRDWIQYRETPDKPPPASLLQHFEKEGSGRNIVYSELVPLNESYEGKTKLHPSIEKFKKDVLKKAAETATAKPSKKVPHYASAGSCARCHSKEFARWTFSGHAKAWSSLIKRQEMKNPECIRCHSTGFGQPGGLGELTASNIRKYKSVQCESCHGPMAGHPEDKTKKSTPISPASCTNCHDEANSPNFDFASYLQRASCQMKPMNQ